MSLALMPDGAAISWGMEGIIDGEKDDEEPGEQG